MRVACASALALLFVTVAPCVLLWPTLAWRNRLSLWAGARLSAWGLFASGVRVRYEGLEHLQRPAILTFNHTSILDFFLNARLAGSRCLVFGKRELARWPGVGWGWYLGGHPLIRREEREHWEAELARVARLMVEEGYSTLIAPEGKRSRDGQLLPFKKGAFHLALQTRLPLIPIVILGSAERMVTGLPTPGQVTIRLLPPISTADWREETLDEHVEEVRRRYLEALAAG